MKIQLVSVFVDDPVGKAYKFYTEILGFVEGSTTQCVQNRRATGFASEKSYRATTIAHFSYKSLVEKVYMPDYFLAIVASPEDPDGTQLLLEPNNNPIATTYQTALYEQGLPCIVFGVEDTQKEYERMTALGVVFRQPPKATDWGTIEAVFEDTCGNLIQMAQLQ